MSSRLYLEHFHLLANQLVTEVDYSRAALPAVGGFLYFTKLPLEIRIVIWSILLPPRVVKLFYDDSSLRDIRLKTDGSGWYINDMGSLLAMCRESRALVMKKYRTALDNESYPLGREDIQMRPTHGYSLDTTQSLRPWR